MISVGKLKDDFMRVGTCKQRKLLTGVLALRKVGNSQKEVNGFSVIRYFIIFLCCTEFINDHLCKVAHRSFFKCSILIGDLILRCGVLCEGGYMCQCHECKECNGSVQIAKIVKPKPKPKRKMTERQLENLRLGKEKRSARNKK